VGKIQMHIPDGRRDYGHIRLVIHKINRPSSKNYIEKIMKDEINTSGGKKIFQKLLPPFFISFKKDKSINESGVKQKNSSPQYQKAYQYDGYRRVAEIKLIDIGKVINRSMEKYDKNHCQASQKIQKTDSFNHVLF
jgi:hypothetical protein